jgi:hypothetical protein
MTMSPVAVLKALNRLVGTWTTEATHPAMAGVVVHGTVIIEWLEGERFLIHRARTDHRDFPDSISIIGFMGEDRAAAGRNGAAVNDDAQLQMHYYDSRGVSRVYEAGIDDQAFRFGLNAPRFRQRFTGNFADGDDTIVGRWQMSEDEGDWKDDLQITYRRS